MSIYLILIDISLSSLMFTSIFMDLDNLSWNVLIFSRFYYLMYQIIIKIYISIRAFCYKCLNHKRMNVMFNC